MHWLDPVFLLKQVHFEPCTKFENARGSKARRAAQTTARGLMQEPALPTCAVCAPFLTTALDGPRAGLWRGRRRPSAFVSFRHLP